MFEATVPQSTEKIPKKKEIKRVAWRSLYIKMFFQEMIGRFYNVSYSSTDFFHFRRTSNSYYLLEHQFVPNLFATRSFPKDLFLKTIGVRISQNINQNFISWNYSLILQF
jgi:hypothetical protein